MKYTSLLVLLISVSLFSKAGDKFVIKPKGYQENASAITKGGNQLSALNKVGGFFRLLEFSTSAQKNTETDLVTFFIAKNDETEITFSVNCAKKIQLHFVLSDANGKHEIKVSEADEYYRFEKKFDISSFKNGLCKLSVYNEKNELIHTMEFEKASL